MMTTKTKKIQKQGKASPTISAQKANNLRNYLKKKLVSPKYADTWLQVLQTHRNQISLKSESFKQTVKQHKDFTCPICFSLMIFPVTLSCKHTFCRPCIEQATLMHDQCCICRAKNDLQYFEVSNKINRIIITIGLTLVSDEEKSQYWQRYNEYISWQRMTMIDPNFKIGELIHFYDYDYSKLHQKGWRYGVITKVTVKQGKDVYLIVQPLYFRQNQQLGQSYTFHYLSSRLAKYQFFFYAKTFKQAWQQDKNKTKIKNRDQQLIQTIKKRILDKSIRERYEHRVLQFCELFNRNKNAIKFLPDLENFKSIREVYNYTFIQFQEGLFFSRDFEFEHFYQMFSSWSNLSSVTILEAE